MEDPQSRCRDAASFLHRTHKSRCQWSSLLPLAACHCLQGKAISILLQKAIAGVCPQFNPENRSIMQRPLPVIPYWGLLGELWTGLESLTFWQPPVDIAANLSHMLGAGWPANDGAYHYNLYTKKRIKVSESQRSVFWIRVATYGHIEYHIESC